MLGKPIQSLAEDYTTIKKDRNNPKSIPAD